MKGSGSADLTVVDRFDGGVGWIAYPDEAMRRASHAVESDGELWVFDPVDAEGVDDLLAEFGNVGGVVVGLDRHVRDSAAVATRHDVPVYAPAWMSGVESDLEAPVERFEGDLAGFEVERLLDNPFWQEAVFFDGETLVVPEALGTAPFFRTPAEELGVHPMLRLLPPRTLVRHDADRLLVGHGEGVHEGVPRTVRDAVENSRARTPRLYLNTLREMAGI